MRCFSRAQARSFCGSHTSTVAVLGRQAGAAATRSCANQIRTVQIVCSEAAVQQQTQPQQRLKAAAAGRAVRCRCSSTPANTESVAPLVVVEGDIVTFHMKCTAEDGQVMESSRDAGEPLSFEIGAGEITGNPLFQAFDGALRGLAVDDVIELEISGGEWKQELLFTVPRDHPEVERLEGRYKNLGGLAKDLAVELANGGMAVVVEVTPEHVKLDANNMMSGKKLIFELEVLSIERP